MIKDTSAQDIEVTTNTSSKKYKAAFGALILLLIGIVSANAFISNGKAELSISRASVQIAPLEIGDLVRDVVATGRVVAANAPQLYSPENGFVALQVEAGDIVTKGQVVAVVESPELLNRAKQEHSELERLIGDLARQKLDARRQTLQLTKLLDLAQVDLQAAEREERRAKASIKANVISQIDLEKAIDDLARAQLTFKHAKEEVSLASDTLAFELDSASATVARQQLVVDELERKIGELDIRASVDGVVGNLFAQQRALVERNAPLMTLVDLSAYEVELRIAESYANELSVGLDVEIQVGGRLVIGTLSNVSPEVSEREVTARVRFDQQKLSGIRQNQQVSARILLENKANVLKVRRGSFLQSGGIVAYKVNGNKAYKTDIQTGATSMRDVEILAGLQPSDRIIISNYDEFNSAESIFLRD